MEEDRFPYFPPKKRKKKKEKKKERVPYWTALE